MCDSSDHAFGVVVELLEPLGNVAEKNYSAFDRELLATYSVIRHLKRMFEPLEFIVSTDHKPKGKHKNASPHQARNVDYIGQFTTDI